MNSLPGKQLPRGSVREAMEEDIGCGQGPVLPRGVAEVIDAAGVTLTHPGNAGAVLPRTLSKPGVNLATRKQGFASTHVF